MLFGMALMQLGTNSEPYLIILGPVSYTHLDVYKRQAITSFSYFPLQLATYLGFIAAGLSVLAIPIVAILRLTTGTALLGQATTLIIVLFLGGVQLISLGIIGEYIGRIYDCLLYTSRESIHKQVDIRIQSAFEGALAAEGVRT